MRLPAALIALKVQFTVQYLVQGHCRRSTGGTGDRTTDPVVSEQPAVAAEPQPLMCWLILLAWLLSIWANDHEAAFSIEPCDDNLKATGSQQQSVCSKVPKLVNPTIEQADIQQDHQISLGLTATEFSQFELITSSSEQPGVIHHMSLLGWTCSATWDCFSSCRAVFSFPSDPWTGLLPLLAHWHIRVERNVASCPFKT